MIQYKHCAKCKSAIPEDITELVIFKILGRIVYLCKTHARELIEEIQIQI